MSRLCLGYLGKIQTSERKQRQQFKYSQGGPLGRHGFVKASVTIVVWLLGFLVLGKQGLNFVAAAEAGAGRLEGKPQQTKG